MPYKYPKLASYEFLAAGNVLYGHPGSPNFPVRLAQEIFLRAEAHFSKKASWTLYDPCCGTGYLLTCLALLNPGKIQQLYGSDVNVEFLSVAEKNMSLLTSTGLDKRKVELQRLWEQFGKASHSLALKHLSEIQHMRGLASQSLQTRVFKRDILQKLAREKVPNFQAEFVIADIPYGNLVEWSNQKSLGLMMEYLLPHLHKEGILALIYPKDQHPKHPAFKRVEKFKIGKRVIELFAVKE
ncbi:MAG: hypothetical protein AAGA10_22585 [Bacteroidota bacterium]